MSKPKLIIFLYFLNSKNKKIYINTKTNQFSGFQELRKKNIYIYIPIVRTKRWRKFQDKKPYKKR